jgi:integrase/recombinase XerC
MTTSIQRVSDWEGLLEQWLKTKDSPRTRQEYTKAVTNAMIAMGDLALLDMQKLTAYRDSLMQRVNGRTLSAATAAHRLTIVKTFISFANSAGACRIPDAALKVLLKRPKVYTDDSFHLPTDDELRAILAACTCERDRVLIAFDNETGLRCDEILAVKLTDFDRTDTGIIILRVRHGKGNKSRTVPVSSVAAALLDAYLKADGRRLGVDEYLFMSRQGGRMDNSRMRQIMINARRAAGIENVSPHKLRHKAAVRWVRHSKNINAVSELLGHASIATTTRYVRHIAVDELAEVVNG